MTRPVDGQSPLPGARGNLDRRPLAPHHASRPREGRAIPVYPLHLSGTPSQLPSALNKMLKSYVVIVFNARKITASSGECR